MSARRKILLLSRLLGQGGSERQLTLTAVSLRRRGRFDVHVGCVKPEGIRADELLIEGIPIQSYPLRTLGALDTVRQGLKLRDYIDRQGIDLVHSFDAPMNIFGVPFAWMARHGVLLSSQRAHRELTPGLHHRLLRISDRLVDGTVVNCEFIRRHLVEDEGVRPERIRLCYNGIDTEQFHPGDRARPPEFGEASLVVGVVCVLRKEKGLSTLVEAFAQVHTMRAGMKLVIVGSGVCLEELQRQTTELGVREKTVFLPETSAVPRLLRGMDVFVLPSLSEALSNSLMEAMASGCCTLASRVGGNPELIHDGVTGFLFEKSDAEGLAAALRRVVRDDNLRRQLAESAKKRIATEFTLEASTRTMEGIYEEFLEGR